MKELHSITNPIHYAFTAPSCPSAFLILYFLYKCAAKRKVQRETHHKMCSRKYEKYAFRNAYACLRLLIHYNTNSVLTSNYSPNDYAPQRARSCTPANNERGGGALRPGVGSPLKIFALARCMQALKKSTLRLERHY